MSNDKHFSIIIIGFVAVVVALAFWPTIGNSVGTVANIQTNANASFTWPAQATVTDFGVCGQQNTTNVVVFNETNATAGFIGPEFPSSNFTISQGTSATDGHLVTQINVTGTLAGYDPEGTSPVVSCSYEPRGYAGESGTRSVFLLIPILAAVALMVALLPRKEVMGWFSK